MRFALPKKAMHLARNGLVSQFLLYTVPLVACVVLGTQFVTGYISLQEREEALISHGRTLARLQADALSRPLWNLDENMVISIMEAVTTDPDFVSASVHDDTDAVVFERALRQVPADQSHTFEIPIVMPVDGGAREVGRLMLTFSTERLEETAWGQVVISAIATAVLVLSLTLVVFLVLRGKVMGPLNALLTAIGHVERKDWRTVDLEMGNEIGQVISAFNRMVGSLESAEHAQRRLREEQERTRETERWAEALLASEERLRSILDALPFPVAIARCDDDRLAYVNQQAEILFGEPSSRLLGSPIGAHWLQPDDSDQIIQMAAREGDVQGLERYIRTASGNAFWALVSAVSMDYGSVPCTLIAFEDISARKDAEEQMRGAKETAERSLRDLKSAQASLIEAEKMASLGGLVAGVAHEINTPVGIILSASSHLREKTVGFEGNLESGKLRKSDLASYVDIVKEASQLVEVNANRAADLVQSFKQVAVDQTSDERRAYELKEYIDEIIMSLRPKFKRALHSVDVACPDDLTVDGYPGALSQVLTNFVINALKHAFEPDGGGHMDIVVTREAGDMVKLVFKDDGKGIPKTHLQKVFDPFFTTARGTGGTGLGLNIVYNVVRGKMGGDITVDSKAGEGTVFTVVFPRVAPDSANAAEAREAVNA